MSVFDGINFPFFTLQQLNLDWLLKEVKRIAGFMPQGGNVGDILTRKADGAEWEVPSAVMLDIDSLPEDTEITDNDQLIFYDISVQANRKIKPPNLLDSMCSDAYPLMNGTASSGTSKKPARYDHVHPTDTSRAPASYFQNQALKVANGGTGANTASGALTNLGAMPQTMADGVIFDFGTGSYFCSVKNSNGNFYIDIPTDCIIPSGKTFTDTIACVLIRGNNSSFSNPTIAVTIVRINAHMLRITVADSGNVASTNYVYSLLLSGTVSMS